MLKRFFKLLYVLALASIALSLPIFLLTSIEWDKVVITSYKAKCLSNNQYVVLQGAPVDEADVVGEIYLNSSENRIAIREQLNFYCKYYDEIQPYIVAYNNVKTRADEFTENLRFVQFKDSKEKTYAYPELYKLEAVKNETQLQEIYNPITDWLIGAFIFFVLLQFIRICYVYVVYGKLIWHPFKNIENI